MTPVPLTRHRLDRGLLVLTAVAILGLLVFSTAAAGGSDHVIVRTCLILLLVARLVACLRRHRSPLNGTQCGLET